MRLENDKTDKNPVVNIELTLAPYFYAKSIQDVSKQHFPNLPA